MSGEKRGASVGWPLEECIQWLESGAPAPLQLQGAEPETLALFAARLLRRGAPPQILIAPTQPEAESLGLALSQLISSDAALRVLPELPIPYDQLALERRQEAELLSWAAAASRGVLPAISVMSAATWGRRQPAHESLAELQLDLRVGEELDRDEVVATLTRLGYQSTKLARVPGSYALRGSLIDIYPPQLSGPVRIDLWDTEIESIQPFDPESQRRRGADQERVLILPVRATPLVEPYLERARRAIMALRRERRIDALSAEAAIEDLENGIPFSGISGAWPIFHEAASVPLATLLPARHLRLFVDPARTREVSATRWARWEQSYEEAMAEGRTVASEPESLQLTPEALDAQLQERNTLYLHQLQLGASASLSLKLPEHTQLRQRLEAARAGALPFAPLESAIREWVEEGLRVCISWGSAAQRDRLELSLEGLSPALLDEHGLPAERPRDDTAARPLGLIESLDALLPGLYLLPGPLRRGLVALEERLILLSAAEILAQPPPAQRRVGSVADEQGPFIRQLDDLDRGDYVVHFDFGIGRFMGIEPHTYKGFTSDYIVIQFAEESRLFLPITRLHQLQRYIGPAGKEPKLKRLGNKSWERSREEARRQAEEQAEELLALYAQRAAASGHAYAAPDDLYRRFEEAFPFRETQDQARAIREVIGDLCAPRPMDRLLCGDVGFGKTEVAMRAAMKVALDGRQVAVLVPTTVLAAQHEKSFRARFTDTPVRIGQLSRFSSASQRRAVKERLAAGELDVVIGTHALVQKSVKFKDLGLLILDEEHRFGVRQKEQLKALRAEVDVLSMTATPIPRTLQLSLNGIRDMSLITTPPRDRLPIETLVCRATEGVVREAILRELSRGGQVFFVHNRVQSIENRKAWLAALVPEARIVVAHGQLDPKTLEEIMVSFTEGAYHVLLTTTIIETGLDLPKVNTIIIDGAHAFGLAQLYQLRGRVGRSAEQGYCYLLVPLREQLSAEARQRLAVLQRFTELGSGFQIASHDLEQRGAGDVLGLRQKGACRSVGVDLYAQLLEREVRRLQGEAAEPPPVPRVTLRVVARIPAEYLPDAHDRFVLYRRLSAAQSEEALSTLEEEVRDRFGDPPRLLINLFYTIRIRNLAARLFATNVEQVEGGVELKFDPRCPLPLPRLLLLLQEPRSGYRAPRDHQLSYRWRQEEGYDPIRGVLRCLQRLAALLD